MEQEANQTDAVPETAANTETPPENQAQVGGALTQEQIDKAMAKRARQARRAMATELGFDDEAALKAAIEALNAQREAAKTDLEKAIERAAALEAELNAERDRVGQMTRQTAIREAAMAAGFRNVDDALPHVSDEVELDEIPAVVEKLAKERPYYLKASTQSLTTDAANGGRSTSGELTDDKLARLRQQFRIGR